jgi:mRNA-degrading endonuclease YafQ of YafQ-DinJ toxin-antitoxin module
LKPPNILSKRQDDFKQDFKQVSAKLAWKSKLAWKRIFTLLSRFGDFRSQLQQHRLARGFRGLTAVDV